jgi:hypothetical protein
MKKITLGWKKKPEKKIELDKGSIMVATHKGDINYLRYVRFKQLAPQFWEKMDSPLFAVYLEKIQDAFNQSNWTKGHAVLLDYKMAIQKGQDDYDAWGLCFALIAYEEGEELAHVPNDVELREKLHRMTKNGLTPDMIQEGVINFMKASPETFQDHLILFAAQSLMTGTEQ